MAARPKARRGPVDWAEIRRRVEAAGRALAGEGDASPERTRVLLEERARLLARPPAPPLAADALEAITFALANETYAVESRYVLEVFRLVDLSLLPGAEPPVFGITAWRGELLTILDLRPVLGLSVAALNELSRVIVLGDERATFGILADAVRDLVTLPASEVREPPEGVAAQRTYLRGMTGDAVLVLEVRALLRLAGPHSTR
ncbi:MAG TPA: chemotaxis protein CheW [Gemmatimonadales bacterium]|nr:chemotaxis protein CheW [Gemmatimonadales bacterium]